MIEILEQNTKFIIMKFPLKVWRVFLTAPKIKQNFKIKSNNLLTDEYASPDELKVLNKKYKKSEMRPVSELYTKYNFV